MATDERRLSDRAVRRWAWATFLFYVVAFVSSAVVDLVGGTEYSDWGGSGLASDIGFVVMISLFPVVGMLITKQQPRNRVGWLLLGIGLAWAYSAVLDSYTLLALVDHPGSLPGGFQVQSISSASWLLPIGVMGIFLILLFPDGRLPSPRWRVLAWTGAAAIVLGTIGIALAPGRVEDVPVPTAENVLAVEALGPVVIAVLVVVLPLLPLCILAAAVALVLRFRRSTGVERLQLKWLTTAGAFVAVAYLLTMATSLPTAFGAVPAADFERWITVLQNVSLLSFGLIPLAIGVAISRHGLYGIDAIISRTLVFGVLAVFITGVYVGIVVGVGALVGQQRPSVALSVLATAVVAVAFQPVRSRVQRWANRLVYGERATPYEVLSDFAGRMTGAYPTAELLPRMAQMVGRCLGGARVEVWLADGPVLVREVGWPDDIDVGAEVALADAGTLPVDCQVEVRHHDELLGLLTVTKPAGEPVTPPEQALLEHVASQAGLVLRNLRLIEDLRSSRERLLTAQEVERRNLERDLHHGAQQSLVGVALLLRLAATRLGDDPDGIGPSVVEASTQLKQAIGELRELARGIHPAVLSDRGLGPALQSLAERSPVPVRVTSDLVERLPRTVEGTLYFAVAEALTNVAKYAAASRVDVTIRRDAQGVSVVVSDDGVGGADPTLGSGLRGLVDRLAVVDGTVEVVSPSGAGTRITCRVPVASGEQATGRAGERDAERADELEPVR